MDNLLLALTNDQLKFVKDLLGRSLESDVPSISRQQVGLALERIAVIEELVSSIWETVSALQSRNVELSQATKPNAERELQTGILRGAHQEIPSSSRTERYLAPDQSLIDVYSELVRKHGELRRETAFMRASIESLVRHLDNFWIGDDETKKMVIQKLRAALSSKIGSAG